MCVLTRQANDHFSFCIPESGKKKSASCHSLTFLMQVALLANYSTLKRAFSVIIAHQDIRNSGTSPLQCEASQPNLNSRFSALC